MTIKIFKPENIYQNLPVFLQNLLVTIKGYHLQKRRTGGDYSYFRHKIRQRDSWKWSQFEEYQLALLRSTVQMCIAEVPYYRNCFLPLGLSHISINSLNDIALFPLLHKKDIKTHTQEFLSNCKNRNMRAIHTTGTTGSPLKVMCDSRARQYNYAFFDEYLHSLGIEANSRHIVIGGRIIINPESVTPPFWRWSKYQNSLLMSSYHLSDQFIGAYVDKIREFNPVYIESYPSSIYRVSQYMRSKNIYIHCKAVVTSGGTLLPEQRELIETAFCCKVYDQYGSAEMSVFAGQCRKGAYHVRPDYSLLELVDDDGKPVPHGKDGNVVCTNFINTAMPLIRYVQGDVAAFGEKCDCGLETPILKYIGGRRDDVVYTSDGRSVGRLSPVLKGFPVESVQYIQRKIGQLEVLIVPDSQFDSNVIAQIEQALRLRVGKNIKIDFSLVDSIPKGKGGKQAAVVSLLDHTKAP